MAKFKINKIIKRKPVKSEPSSFDLEDCTSFFPSDLFNSVIVSTVHFKKGTISDMLTYVSESLKEEPVKEVGGFLLGKSRKTNEKFWEVLVEFFLPTPVVDFSSPNRLNFGPIALLELDKALSDRNNQDLIGWFHTHTAGKTPFLSIFDLNIHNGFFSKPYQIAVETDSITRQFETGIFCQKQDGTMNYRIELNERKGFPWKGYFQ